MGLLGPRLFWTNPGPFRMALVGNQNAWFSRLMPDQLFLENSISYACGGHSETGNRLTNGYSSLDPRADKCDLTFVFVFESHFLLNMTLPFGGMHIWWCPGSRARTCMLCLRDAILMCLYVTVGSNWYLRPGLALNGQDSSPSGHYKCHWSCSFVEGKTHLERGQGPVAVIWGVWRQM